MRGWIGICLARPGKFSSTGPLRFTVQPSPFHATNKEPTSSCERINEMIAPRLFLLQAVLGLLFAPTAFAERRVRSRSPRNQGFPAIQATIFDFCYVRGIARLPKT
jgi:hypothetical protein